MFIRVRSVRTTLVVCVNEFFKPPTYNDEENGKGKCKLIIAVFQYISVQNQYNITRAVRVHFLSLSKKNNNLWKNPE